MKYQPSLQNWIHNSFLILVSHVRKEFGNSCTPLMTVTPCPSLNTLMVYKKVSLVKLDRFNLKKKEIKYSVASLRQPRLHHKALSQNKISLKEQKKWNVNYWRLRKKTHKRGSFPCLMVIINIFNSWFF